MNLEDIVLAAMCFVRAMFIPPNPGLEAWVHNTAGVCVLVAGAARFFGG